MITVLMGAPGAGKSTWVAANKTGLEYIYNTEAVRVNRDLDVGRYMYVLRQKAVAAVESGQDLIADGTHTIRTHRTVWLNLAKRLSLPTKLIVFNTSYETCLQVQMQRQHPAPANVVRDHHGRMRRAMHEIKSENWGHIEIITR
jgi:predicted kinase